MGIRLDKVVLINLYVDLYKTDVSKLLGKEEVKVKECVDQDGCVFHTITFKRGNPMFDECFFGISEEGKYYSRLSLSVNDGNWGNRYGTSISQLQTKLEAICEYLKCEYNINVQCVYAKVQYIEIQNTFRLNNKYSEYTRVINQLIHNLPKRLQLGEVHGWENKENEDERESKSFSRNSGERGIEVTIYNKSEQSGQTPNGEDEFLRFEVSLKSAAKIKDKLGTNMVYKMQMSNIEDYFRDFINKMLLSNQKNQNKRNKELNKIMLDKYNESERKWINHLLAYIENEELNTGKVSVLSINQLFPLLKKMGFKNLSSITNAKHRLQEEAIKNFSVLFCGDELRLSELAAKLVK